MGTSATTTPVASPRKLLLALFTCIPVSQPTQPTLRYAASAAFAASAAALPPRALLNTTISPHYQNSPQLNSLTCCAIYSKGCDSLLPIDDEAAEQLASATQLTSLVLCDCGLQDSAVNTIAGSLKRLRKLKLDCNPGDALVH